MVLKQFLAINVFAIVATISLVAWHGHNEMERETWWVNSAAYDMDSDTKPMTRESQSLPCDLLPRPVPMILMSLGRSGTASMYQVVSRLSGDHGTQNNNILEYTGSSTEKSIHFFQNVIPQEDVMGDWLIRYLCNEQKKYPDAGVVAFKWKPYETLFGEEKALQGLELLGRLKEVQIKVVRSKRNLLDVMISRRKHKSSLRTHGEDEKIRSHCQKEDKECIESQLRAGTGVTLPTKHLLKELKHLHEMEDETDSILRKYNVPTIHVSFEKLFSIDEDTSEWKRIFDYLGVGPRHLLARKDIEEAGHAATSIPLHNVTLSNYDEVRSVLVGSDFEHLLH